MKIVPEMLSPYSQQLIKDLNLGNGTVPKLVPNLFDTSNYVLHYRNLQLYLVLGIAAVNAVFLHSCGRMKKEVFKNVYVTVWCPTQYLK